MKYITVKLTEDQVRFLDNLIVTHVTHSVVRQAPARYAFGYRLRQTLAKAKS